LDETPNVASLNNVASQNVNWIIFFIITFVRKKFYNLEKIENFRKFETTMKYINYYFPNNPLCESFYISIIDLYNILIIESEL